MLPSPSVSRYQRRARLDTSPLKKLLETLTRRSRLTNLGVFLLTGLCALSLFFNLLYWTSNSSIGSTQYRNRASLLAVNRPESRTFLDHLIVVPCHAIWKGASHSWLDEKDWYLESYQTGPGRVQAFYEHISKSVQFAKEDPRSLLVFSGGQTKSISSTTEAESYLRLAQTAGILSKGFAQSLSSAEMRTTTENYAMDSYQNLLFSIARFHEFTGHFPTKITVIGYEFKRRRFTELHRKAIAWPQNKFNYVGVDPNHDGSGTNAIAGERQNGYLPYSVDLYGFHPYHTSSPEIAPLLDWCPGDSEGGEDALFEGDLPWDRIRHTISRDA
ncbi:hypothetical protein CVT25_011067 [Psilocybe cyanescens]|uniref:DUF218 domain-containing protein n=1 Tax=Psilocybe cyanescens TaxID=93625 RepID=A0A409WFH3_PSICY|nr:hypothetical protein CVT25_011067 [Psilocybe cyanescens]